MTKTGPPTAPGQPLGWDNRPLSGKRGQPSPRSTIALTDDDREQLAAIAAKRGITNAEAIRRLIREETARTT